MPVAKPNYGQAVSTPLASVNRSFLAEYYRTGQYSDLEVVSNDVVHKVHKIIVCSESPAIQFECDCLKHDRRVTLNQYDPETLGRVLDFCYRHTYSDGEYAEIVPPFLLSMADTDIRDTLESPLAVVSDIADRDWWADCIHCDGHEAGEDHKDDENGEGGGGADEDEDDDENEEDREKENEGAQSEQSEREADSKEGQDEYLPDHCDIHCSFEVKSDSSDNEMPPTDMPADLQELGELLQPPYEISLFTNLKVYIAAKELQIPALQLLARERFAHTLRTHWARFEEFPALIDEVYIGTEPKDHLRALISQIVAAEYANEQEMVFKAEIRQAMARNGEFALDVLDTVLRLRSEWADAA